MGIGWDDLPPSPNADPETGEIISNLKPTQFGDVEPGTQEVCDIWVEQMEELVPDYRLGSWLRKTVVAGARDWFQQFGVAEQRLRDTMRKMHKQGLDMKNPRSCISVGLKWSVSGNTELTPEQARRKYLGGEYADAIQH